MTRNDGGEIAVHGRKLKLNHPGDAIAAGLVLVPANRLQALLPQRSIRENVALPLVRNPSNWGLINARTERERVSNAVKRLQIDTRAESQLRRLSGGNQQKVVIARWIATGFQTLLCFDPTRGIDIGTKHQIYRLLREMADAGPPCFCSRPSFRKLPWCATGRSLCSGAKSSPRCPLAKPTRKPCFAPHTAWRSLPPWGGPARQRPVKGHRRDNRAGRHFILERSGSRPKFRAYRQDLGRRPAVSRFIRHAGALPCLPDGHRRDPSPI